MLKVLEVRPANGGLGFERVSLALVVMSRVSSANQMKIRVHIIRVIIGRAELYSLGHIKLHEFTSLNGNRISRALNRYTIRVQLGFIIIFFFFLLLIFFAGSSAILMRNINISRWRSIAGVKMWLGKGGGIGSGVLR